MLKIEEAGSVGEKEWYFFCRRGKKYKNSVRPNRVTGSGFWKATGIDKAIYSVKEPHECIGLKKSLVYYRGSAGKGTKTDWMMHEFRLPATKSTNLSVTKNTTHEAVRFIRLPILLFQIISASIVLCFIALNVSTLYILLYMYHSHDPLLCLSQVILIQA